MKNNEAFITINHVDSYVPKSSANTAFIRPEADVDVVFKGASTEDNVPKYTLVIAQKANLLNDETTEIKPLFLHNETWKDDGYLITNQVEKVESSKYSETSLIKINTVKFYPNSVLNIDCLTIRYSTDTGDIDSNSRFYCNYLFSIDWRDLNDRLNKLAPLEKIDLSDNFYKEFFGIKENDNIPSDIIYLLENFRKVHNFVLEVDNSDYTLNPGYTLKQDCSVNLLGDDIVTDIVE